MSIKGRVYSSNHRVVTIGGNTTISGICREVVDHNQMPEDREYMVTVEFLCGPDDADSLVKQVRAHAEGES